MRKYYTCPICDKYDFIRDHKDEFDRCFHCGWVFDLNQYKDHSLKNGMNEKSVDEYKKEYEELIKEDPEYEWCEVMYPPIPHKCPVCGKTTFPYENSHNVCHYCGWEDDVIMEEDPDFNTRANDLTLNEYKKRYQRIIEEDPNYKRRK